MPNLATVTQAGNWSVNAYGGATVNVSALTSLTSTHGMYFEDTGGSTLNDSRLTTWNGVNFTTDGTDASVANSWTSFIDGRLEVDYGMAVTLPNLTNVNQSSLDAQNGGQLTLAGVTSYASNGTTFQAQGSDTGSGTVSLLAMPNLATVTQAGNWSVNAYGGATVNVSALTSLTSTDGMYFEDTGGSTLNDSRLTTLTATTGAFAFTLDGTDTQVASSWTSFLDSSLYVTGGSYSLPGLTDVDLSGLHISGGGSLTLPNLTSYNSYGTFEAVGTNTTTGQPSVLDLPTLTTVTQQNYWDVNATQGGEVNLSALTSLTSTQGITITDTGSSTLVDSNLTSLTGVGIYLDGTDAQVSNSWTTLHNDTVSLSGGTLTLPALTALNNSTINLSNSAAVSAIANGAITLSNDVNINGNGTLTVGGAPALTSASLTVSSGAAVTLASGTTSEGMTTLLTTGSGSTIALDNASIAEPTDGSILLIETQNGGTLTMPDLTAISGGPVVMLSSGSGSKVSLAALQTFTSTGGATASSGGAIQSGIVLPAAPDIWLNANSDNWNDNSAWLLGVPTASTPAFISTASPLTVTLYFDSTDSAASLTLGVNDTLEIEDAATLTISGNVVNNGTLSLDAGGTLNVGGNLTQSAAATVNEQVGSTPANGFLGKIAVTGAATLAGTFNLSIVDGYTPSLNQSYPVITYASHSGNFSTYTGMNVGGQVFTPVVGPGGLALAVNPTPPSWNLSGSQHQPPTQGVGDDMTYQFAAIGTSPITYTSTNLPPWASLSSSGLLTGTPPAAGQYSFDVTASNGIPPTATVLVTVTAQIQPPIFVDDSPPAGIGGAPYTYQFVATGAGNQAIAYSATNLPGWAQINPTSGLLTGTPTVDGTYNFSVTANNGITPNTTIPVSIVVAGGTAETITVAAGQTYMVPDGTYAGGTTFNIGANATVTIDTGTFTGGGIFDVGPGAVVNITGGNYSGTFIGGGGGTVQIDGDIDPALGGITFDFPGNMLQWTGGAFFANLGDLTNLGTMNLAGSNDKGLYEDSTLYNYGTIIQTGTGNLNLHSDNITPTTFVNEAGASYLIESDSGIDNLSGDTALVNDGLIEKTTGTGTSQLYINGASSNTGTIEADSGTLYLDASSLSQLSGSTLTGGTWYALEGASLEFPSVAAITSNAGNLSLGGAGSVIQGVAGLTSNSGSITVADGATLTTIGNFTNSGSLTVGPTSMFIVSGALTQTATGTTTVQIGGTPASDQFGNVSVTGKATLAGSLDLGLVNGYTPTPSLQYQVMSFASSSGGFTSLSLGKAFSQTLNNTSLDVNTIVTNPVEVTVSNVSVPSSATPGQPITVTWQATNTSANNATGNWQDSVYLSPTDAITANSTVLGTAMHTGGLAANGTYGGTLTAAMPALSPGSYYVLVVADSLYQLSEASRAGNTEAATNQVTLSLPSLVVGTPYNDSFAVANQNNYYRVNVPAGGAFSISLQSSAASGTVALYVSQGTLPTPYNNLYSATTAKQPDQTVTIPQVLTAGTYYVLAQSLAGAAASAAYTLTATQSSALAITSIPATPSGNGGNATVEIDGTNFAPNATATLTLGGATITATSIQYVSASQIFAVFNLTGAAVGNYTLQVQQGGESATASAPFQVVAATTGNPLVYSLDAPSLVRAGRSGVVDVTVTNVSNNDVPAPLLVISATGATVSLPSNPAFAPSSLSFLAASATGEAGTLTAGETVTIPIDFQSTATEPDVDLQLGQTDTSQPFSWAEIASGVAEYETNQPNATAALTNLENEVGSTWANYVAMLDSNANLIPAALGDPENVKDLFNIEFNKALAAVNTSISGTLQDSEPGMSLGGLTVYASDTTSGATFSTTTLNDGSFAFPTLPSSTYTLGVNGVLVSTQQTYTLAAGQSMTGVHLNATPGAQIAGQVMDPVSNLPIPGATITATNETTGQGFSVTTDSNGNYMLSGLPAAVYDLVVTAPSYARSEVAGVDVTQSNATEVVSLVGEGVITGTIASASGGLQESTLTVTAGIVGSTDANQTFTTTSTTTGFELDGLPAGTYNVTLSLPGYIPQTESGVVVTGGQSTDLGTITLSPASEIDGTVTSSDPAVPATGLVIQAVKGGTIVGSAVTNASGTFQIMNLPAGTYTLTAPLAVVANGPTVTVAAGQIVTGELIQVQPGGAISGRVSSSSGTLLPGLTVELSGPNGLAETTTTDSSGGYEFESLVSGSYEVYLQIGGTQALQTVNVMELDGSAVTANLQLPYAAEITGTVTDGSGNPITDGTITLYSSGSLIATAETNASGVYEFLVMQPGTFDLSASASEGTFPTITGLMVAVGNTATQNFQIGTATLAVSATDGTTAVAGDEATLLMTVEGSPAIVDQAVVGADGSASFAGLADNSYTVFVSSATGDFGQSSVSLTAGQQGTASVSMSPSGTVSGKVIDSSGNPISGASVFIQLSSDLQNGYSTVTATDGTYSLAGIAPGTYDVTVVADGFVANVQTGVSVSSSTTVNASLTASTTTATGTIEDTSGNPVPNANITITDAADHVVGIVEANPNGTFTVSTAQGSGLSMQVSAQGYASQTVAINIPTGTSTQLSAVQLQAIAIDPGPAGNPPPSPPGGIDGQAWADQLSDAALKILYEVDFADTPLPPKPSCDSCLPAWMAVQTDVENLNRFGPLVVDNGNQVMNQAQVLSAAVSQDTAALYLAEGILLGMPAAEAISLFGAGGGFSTAFKAGKLGGVYLALYSIADTLSTLGPYLSKITSDGGELLTDAAALSSASGLGAIQSLQQDAHATAMDQSAQIPQAMAYLDKALFFEPYMNWDAKQVLGDLKLDLSQYLNIESTDPFANTLAAATTLDSYNNTLQTAYGNWKSALAKYKSDIAKLNQCQSQPCDPNPPNNPGPQKKIPDPNSNDPNSLTGPVAFGTLNYVLDTGNSPYTVEFENDGTAAALDVNVSEQLADNLDWSTFQFGSFGFGSAIVNVPAGLTQYQTTVSYQNSDGIPLNVLVDLNFNVQTGLMTASFTSVDPATGQAPTGVFDGFLYPDNASGSGEGHVEYTVQPESGLATGTTINQQASVVFDTNASISTNTVTDTIDATPPTSSVTALAPTVTSAFKVSWAGTDTTGPGIATYDVYVSTNGGAFTPWLTNDSAPSAVYQNAIVGNTYSFYSVATDLAGLVQPTPSAAQTSTTIVAQPAFSLTKSTVTASTAFQAGTNTTITFQAYTSTGVKELTGGLDVTFALGSTTGGQGTIGPAIDNGNGTYTATFMGITAGSNTIVATINGKKVTSKAASIKVTDGPLDVATSVVEESAAYVEVGSKLTVTLQPEDSEGNKLIDAGQSVDISLGGGSGEGMLTAAKYNANGTYTATFTGSVVGTNTFVATINGNTVTSSAAFSVAPGPVTLSKSIVTLSSNTVESEGIPITVTLHVVASTGLGSTSGLTVLFSTGNTKAGAQGTFSAVTDHGNGTYTAIFTGALAGSNTIVATIEGAKLTSKAPSITVTDGLFDMATSTITASAKTVTVGGKVTVTFQPRDAAGNTLPNQKNLTLTFDASGVTGGSFSAAKYNANGTYTATFTAGTTAGDVIITATDGGETTAVGAAVTVAPGAASTITSTLNFPNGTTVTAGQTIGIILQAEDLDGNIITTSGAAVAFTLVPTVGDNGKGTFIGPVKYIGDGQYEATFMGTVAGMLNVTATVGGKKLTAAPTTVTVDS